MNALIEAARADLGVQGRQRAEPRTYYAGSSLEVSLWIAQTSSIPLKRRARSGGLLVPMLGTSTVHARSAVPATDRIHESLLGLTGNAVAHFEGNVPAQMAKFVGGAFHSGGLAGQRIARRPARATHRNSRAGSPTRSIMSRTAAR